MGYEGIQVELVVVYLFLNAQPTVFGEQCKQYFFVLVGHIRMSLTNPLLLLNARSGDEVLDALPQVAARLYDETAEGTGGF